MKQLWYNFKYFLFSLKFNFFDFWAMWMITTFAVRDSWWLFLLLIPAIMFSVVMERRVREEKENAQVSNGTVG